MKSTLTLPPPTEPQSDLFSQTVSLPEVRRVRSAGPILKPWPAGGSNVFAITLAQGCSHRCSFCSARAIASYPGDHQVMLFHDLVPQLTTELAALPILPRAVVLGPDTDPFMPLAEVQADTVRAIEALAKHGIPSWVMTRGFIRPMAREVLVERRDLLRVTVGLSTLDRDLQRLVEPLAAPPRMRLRQIATLLGRGVSVRVELGPLVPGLTDTRANLSTLLDGLADVGVRQVTTSYMFSRPGIRDQMVRSLESLGLEDQVLEAFEGGPTVNLGGGPPVLLMPKARRQRGYATLMALAAGRGMTVSVNALTNPDFVPTRPAPVSLVPRLSRAHAG